MDMLGIDLGNWSCHLERNQGRPWIMRCLNEKTEVKTKISQIKCLLGRKFFDPQLQLQLDYVPFRVIEGPDGYPLVHARCNGEDRAFTPVEILAMLLCSPQLLRRIKNSDYSPCMGIPIYFTDQQKKDVLEAAKIAGLPASFVLLDETIAIVRAADNFSPDKCHPIIAFVDIGHSSMQVCFAEFKMDCSSRNSLQWITSVNILYKGYARSLGGREFDNVLFKHFACKIRKEYNIDVSNNSGAFVRLSEACDRLKNDLSKNNEASFTIEKFSGLVDVKGSITRKEFEALSSPILEEIEVALKKALNKSGLNVEKIELIELVGNGCSIPAIIDILTKIFGKKISYNKNISDGIVARGCARQPTREITGTERMIEDLETTGLKTSELVSKAEDSEKFLWRRAMHEKGHSLTFLIDFLEENMHRIGRSEKTEVESYWLSKANYNFDERERHALPREHSEADQKLKEPLMSERDDSRKEELCRRLTELQPPGSQCVGYFAKYSYSELQVATNNFHESFKLGEGGFGVVYKGIHHNTTIAIKMLKDGSRQGAKEFNQEVDVLSKLQHPNLVKLIGACAETPALIYEYLPNGSLEDRLQCKNNTLPLSWQARVRIAYEICSALSFLHCSEPHGIVHGDLKPENILLDGNDKSKICDFGLCRELTYTASTSIPYHCTDRPKGTLAYMDPEYFSIGKITPQYDVYSFGILLLRLATCRNPVGIRPLVEEAQKKGTLKTLINAPAGLWPFKETKKMISLGLRCSDPIRKNRPDLSTKVFKEIKSMLQVDSASQSSCAGLLSLF